MQYALYYDELHCAERTVVDDEIVWNEKFNRTYIN